MTIQGVLGITESDCVKMKIKVQNKEFKLVIKVKTFFKEHILSDELQLFNQGGVNGFWKVEHADKHTVVLTGPVGISLTERLKKTMDKRDILLIVEQFLVAIEQLKLAKLPLNNMLLDFRYIFINEVTKELKFMYLPMNPPLCNPEEKAFLESLLYSLKPCDEDDREFLARFIYEIKTMDTFDEVVLEELIKHEDASVVKSIRGLYSIANRGGSKKDCTGASLDFKTESGNMIAKIKKDDISQTLYENDGAGLTELLEDEETGLLDEETGLIDEATGLLGEETGLIGEATGLIDEATGLLDEETGLIDEATGLLGEENLKLNSNIDNMAKEKHTPNSTIDNEETDNLNEQDEGDNVAINRPAAIALLTRLSTNEAVIIDKPVFRIGKKGGCADYNIDDNKAVSKNHADIIIRGSLCFIRDLESTNHTYIDGRIIPTKQEVEIYDGSFIMFGNEVFLFTLNLSEQNKIEER